MERWLRLADLHELCERYVPIGSRHPKSRLRSARDTWWPAHELGHLLTVPAARIGVPLFGLYDDTLPDRWAYELAAMHVSRRLLDACGRADLHAAELEDTDDRLLEHGSHELAKDILHLGGVLRLPRSRQGLEAKLRRVAG